MTVCHLRKRHFPQSSLTLTNLDWIMSVAQASFNINKPHPPQKTSKIKIRDVRE